MHINELYHTILHWDKRLFPVYSLLLEYIKEPISKFHLETLRNYKRPSVTRKN